MKYVVVRKEFGLLLVKCTSQNSNGRKFSSLDSVVDYLKICKLLTPILPQDVQ